MSPDHSTSLPSLTPFGRAARALSAETVRVGRVLAPREIAKFFRSYWRAQADLSAESLPLEVAQRLAGVPAHFLLKASSEGAFPIRRVPLRRRPLRRSFAVEVPTGPFLNFLARLEERRQTEELVSRARYLAQLVVHVRQRYGEAAAAELLAKIRDGRRDEEKAKP